MRVSAVNNNQNKINFSGVFKKNKDIETIVKASTYENMVRFQELLKRMKKVKDEYVYVFEKKTYTNEVMPDYPFGEYETVTTTGFELSRQKGNDESTKKWVAGFEDDFYMPKLGEINDRLERLYPQRAGKKTKGKKTEEILNMMV